MLQPNVTYRLKELNPEDPMDSTLEKTGHVVEFSMTAVNNNKVAVDKAIRELQAQKDHEDAKMRNIEEHHAFVQEMTDFELATASMYNDSKVLSKACAEKLVELAEQVRKDDEEVAEIFRQVPELNLVPSKSLDPDLPAPEAAPVEEVPAAETQTEEVPVVEVPSEEAPVTEEVAAPSTEEETKPEENV